MSSLARIAGYLVMLGCVPIVIARGQDSRILAARVQRATAEAVRRSQALAEFQRANARAKLMTDTFATANGTITVMTDRGTAAAARAAMARVDSTVRVLGPRLSLLRGSTLTVQFDSSRRYNSEAKPVAVLRFDTPPIKGTFFTVTPVDADSIAATIEDQTSQRLLQRSATPFASWFLGSLPIRPADLEQEPDWSSVRYDILDSRAVIGKRCYQGELTACSMLLGLTVADDPIMSWYDSLARVDYVREHPNDARAYNRADTDACLAGSDAACGRVLSSMRRLDTPPVGASARSPLVREALLMGGPGAFDRLVSNTASPSDAIAAAAGAPIDSVMRRWQRNVREKSIGSEDLSVKIVLMTLGWIALLLVLSSRISRWR